MDEIIQSVRNILLEEERELKLIKDNFYEKIDNFEPKPLHMNVYFDVERQDLDKLKISLNDLKNSTHFKDLWYEDSNRLNFTALHLSVVLRIDSHSVDEDINLDFIIELLNGGADINAKDSEGRTVLHYAAYFGSLKLVKYLVSRGANVNFKDVRLRTALHYAAKRGHSDICIFLIDDGMADINCQDKKGFTALSFAVNVDFNPTEWEFNEDDRALENLVYYGYDHDHDYDKNYDEDYLGSIDCLNVLLDRGADVDIKDKEGRTILQQSLVSDMIKLLVEKGAKINSKGQHGQTILLTLSDCYDPDVFSYCLELGADINSKDDNGRSCLHRANTDSILFFLSRGADINSKDNEGKTALHLAVAQKTYRRDEERLKTVGILLDNGAIISKDNNGKTPLDAAYLRGDAKCSFLLLLGVVLSCFGSKSVDLGTLKQLLTEERPTEDKSQVVSQGIVVSERALVWSTIESIVRYLDSICVKKQDLKVTSITELYNLKKEKTSSMPNVDSIRTQDFANVLCKLDSYFVISSLEKFFYKYLKHVQQTSTAKVRLKMRKATSSKVRKYCNDGMLYM